MRKVELKDVYLSYPLRSGQVKHVLNGVNLSVPENISMGILGRNGAGKSTMINILSGVLKPDRGTVNNDGLKLSWPIGKPAFQGNLSARNNIKFICRILGENIAPVMDYVDDFAELDNYMDMPIRTYSSGMKSRLGFAISMAVDFNCLLVDEGFSAGDARFRKKMKDEFEKKKSHTNMICVSHNIKTIRTFCDTAAILDNGKVTVYDNINEAKEIYVNL